MTLEKNLLLEIQKFLLKFPKIEEANSNLISKTNINVSRGMIKFDSGEVEHVFMYNLNPKYRPICRMELEANGLILSSNCDIVSMGHPVIQDIKDVDLDVRWGRGWLEPEFQGVYFVVYNYKGKTFVQTEDVADITLDPSKQTLLIKLADLLQGVDFRAPEIDPDDNLCWVFKYITKDVCAVLNDGKLMLAQKNSVVLMFGYNKRLNRRVVRKYVESFGTRYKLPVYGRRFPDSKQALLAMTKCSNRKNFKSFLFVDDLGMVLRVGCNSKNPIDKVLKLKEDITEKFLIEMILDGGYDDVLIDRPEYNDVITILEDILHEVIDDLDSLWVRWSKRTESRAEFAELAKTHPLSNILFSLWDENIVSIEGLCRRIPYDYVLKNISSVNRIKLGSAMEKLKTNLKEDKVGANTI